MADEIDETTLQSMRNARENAGIPLTSGDLAGTSGDADYVDETVAERGTTDTDTEPVLTSGDITDETAGVEAEGEEVPHRYEDRTALQLREAAKAKGLSTSGTKDELIARLRGED